MSGIPYHMRGELFSSADPSAKGLNTYCEQVAPMVRPKPETDPEAFARLHAVNGCKVWHRGMGVLHGGGDFSPARIMAERSEVTAPCGCVRDGASGVTVRPCATHQDYKLRRAERRMSEYRSSGWERS